RVSFWRRMLPFETEPAASTEPAIDGRTWEDERGRARRMAEALATLAPATREAVVLFEIEGFAIEEIAVMQGDSVSAVKSRLVRGRRQLRRHYERLFADDEGPVEPCGVREVPARCGQGREDHRR